MNWFLEYKKEEFLLFTQTSVRVSCLNMLG